MVAVNIAMAGLESDHHNPKKKPTSRNTEPERKSKTGDTDIVTEK
jgi:hypothetical protein